MTKYSLSHGGFTGIVHFTERQWRRLQCVGRVTFTAEQRSSIQNALNQYALFVSCNENEIDISDIQRPLQEIVAEGKRLCHLILASDFSSPPGQAVLLLRKQLGGPKPDGSDVLPAYHAMRDIIDAGQKALSCLVMERVEAKPGPKHEPIFRELISNLGSVYEAAGGKPSVGTRRASGREWRGSLFGDFVYLLLQVARHQISQPLPKHTRLALAESIRRARTKERRSPGG